MLRGLLHIVTGRSERRNQIQRVTFTEPWRRFNDVENRYFPPFKSLAKALARQTKLMVESLLADAAIPDWASAGESAQAQQLIDLSIFCSHCLVQFTVNSVEPKSVDTSLPAGLRTALFDLVHRMYGDFATKSPLGAITFDESLQSRNLDDDLEIRDLTRLLDQLMDIDGSDSHREVKIQKLRTLLTAHRRAFEYRLHSVL